jgi:polyisoprenoid-binding protein YceI
MIGSGTGIAALAALAIFACSPSGPETAFAGSSLAGNRGAAAASVAGERLQAVAARFIVAPTGNVARYRVRERLVNHDLPNDAVGETKALAGMISFDSRGQVIRQASRFTVDASSFVSDMNRRDGFVRGRLLEADQYPSVVLVPTEVRGVSLPLPKSGSVPIEMTADLTVRDVTRPTIWKGIAKFEDSRITGTAATSFTFDDIQLEQPRVSVLLSVADTIHLEIDFNLAPQK